MSSDSAASPSREAMARIDDLIRELRIAIEVHIPYYTNLVRLEPAVEQARRADAFVRPLACRLEAVLREVFPVEGPDPSPVLHALFGLRDALKYWMTARGWSNYWYLCTYYDRGEWDRDWELEAKFLPLSDRHGGSREPSLEDSSNADMYINDSFCKIMDAIKRHEAARGAKDGGTTRENADRPEVDRGRWLSLSNGERLREFMAGRERATYEEVMEAVLGPGGRVADGTIRAWVGKANLVGGRVALSQLRCRDRCVVKGD